MTFGLFPSAPPSSLVDYDLVGSADPAVDWRDGDEAMWASLAKGAAHRDRHAVSRSILDRLAGQGWLGSPLPSPGQQRDLAERLAAADASVWFCWAQHQTPLRALENAQATDETPGVEELRRAHLGPLRCGEEIAAVAFAHVRRPGPPNPVAERTAGGWRFRGRLDWVTNWDNADLVLVMARGAGNDTSSLVSALLPAGFAAESWPGLAVKPPLELLALGGTYTRPIELDGFIPNTRIVAVQDLEAWRSADAAKTVHGNPAVYGLARGALADLVTRGRDRGDSACGEAAEALAKEIRTVRNRAYELLGEPDSPAVRAEAIALRATSLDLATEAAVTALTARAGAGVLSGCDQERRVREAMFLRIQAQTADSRSASLQRIIERSQKTT